MSTHTDSGALSRARRAYEHRTDLRVVAIRLSADARERLERLAARCGGKREAVEAALIELERPKP